jgi:peptidyl-prolyl cis-trans isomerase SurA
MRNPLDPEMQDTAAPRSNPVSLQCSISQFAHDIPRRLRASCREQTRKLQGWGGRGPQGEFSPLIECIEAVVGFDLQRQVIRMLPTDLLKTPNAPHVRGRPQKSRDMIPSRSLYIPAILILGASLAAAPLLAQTASGAAATEEAPAPANSKVVEDIVARVNDQIVTQSDYDRAAEQMRAEATQQNATPQEIDDRNKNLLRDLIDQQLLLSKGKDLGITGEAELVKRLDDIRKQNHLDSMEDLEKAAQEQGVSYEDFKASIRNGIITQQVIQDEVSRHVQLSQADVQAYFKAHQTEFAHPESVHLREILVATPAGSAADSPEVTAAGQQAEAIEAKLKGGANFEELAKTSSSGPGADRGGDLGEFRRGMLAKQLEDQTFSLKAGQFTDPIRTKQGFVILEVAEHTPAGEASFKDVQEQVEEAVFSQQMQPALREYLTKLREAAYVDIKPGFVDTGASPDEIHPSYSAYVPPGPKQKKKFVHVRFTSKQQPTASSGNTQTANNAAGTTAAPAAPAAQVASASNESVQNPGKREKVRFGQAPQQSLPAAQSPSESTSGAATTQTADAANPDLPAVDFGNATGAGAQDQETQGKTRFSQRPIVHKAKKPQGSSDADKDTAPKDTAPSPDELATQKVQDTPLGLTEQPAKTKKKKEKGEKTRYAAKEKQPEPEQVQQPYMGGQKPVDGDAPAAAPQPAASDAQPRPTTPGTTPNGTQP